MKRLFRCLTTPLVTVVAAAVAAAVLAAPISGTAAAATGDQFGPGPVRLTTAAHKPSKATSVAAAALGDRVVFRAGTPATGHELWVTDGTPAGTRLLADIRPGTDDGYPADLAGFGGRVFFGANDGVHGNELWVTDGTPEGTGLYADLASGPDGSYPTGLVVASDRLFFGAATPEAGKELWVIDAPAGRPRQVTDILDGRGSASPIRLTPFRDQVVFSATLRESGGALVEKPFISDGTAAGTGRLDSLPMPTSAQGLEFVAAGDRLFLSVLTADSGVDLWSSAGVAGDARLVKDINPGGNDSVGQLTVAGDRVVFTALNQATGSEVWTSDGTPGGTQLLRDIRAGAASSVPSGYQVQEGRVWFAAEDGVHGRELWSSDGTTGGTALVQDTVPGAMGSDPAPLGLVGDRGLWSLETPEAGVEPWVSGPGGRLVPLGDVRPGPDGSDPESLGVLGNTWIFAGTDGAGPGVFAATLQGSSVQAQPKRRYPEKKARAKRVKVKVAVTPAVSGGAVEILRKGRVVGRATIENGVAKVRITKRLKPGKHKLRAVYRGSVWAQASAPDTFRICIQGGRS